MFPFHSSDKKGKGKKHAHKKTARQPDDGQDSGHCDEDSEFNCGGQQPGCGVFNSENIHDKWPNIQYIPRPEPDSEHVAAHWKWEQEYRTWRNLVCGNGPGYFCRRHGIWIPCSQVIDGKAPGREQQDEKGALCPESHYDRDRGLLTVGKTMEMERDEIRIARAQSSHWPASGAATIAHHQHYQQPAMDDQDPAEGLGQDVYELSVAPEQADQAHSRQDYSYLQSTVPGAEEGEGVGHAQESSDGDPDDAGDADDPVYSTSHNTPLENYEQEYPGSDTDTLAISTHHSVDTRMYTPQSSSSRLSSTMPQQGSMDTRQNWAGYHSFEPTTHVNTYSTDPIDATEELSTLQPSDYAPVSDTGYEYQYDDGRYEDSRGFVRHDEPLPAHNKSSGKRRQHRH